MVPAATTEPMSRRYVANQRDRTPLAIRYGIRSHSRPLIRKNRNPAQPTRRSHSRSRLFMVFEFVQPNAQNYGLVRAGRYGGRSVRIFVAA